MILYAILQLATFIAMGLIIRKHEYGPKEASKLMLLSILPGLNAVMLLTAIMELLS